MDNKTNNEEEKIYYVKRIEKLEAKEKILNKRMQYATLWLLVLTAVNAISKYAVPDDLLVQILMKNNLKDLISFAFYFYAGFSNYKLSFELKKTTKKLEKIEKVEEIEKTEEMEGKTK